MDQFQLLHIFEQVSTWQIFSNYCKFKKVEMKKKTTQQKTEMLPYCNNIGYKKGKNLSNN